MNGPEHYREAERLIAGPNRDAYDWDHDGEAAYQHARRDNLDEAQIHATLALAAATAEQTAARGPGDIDQAWLPILRGDDA